MGKWEQSEIDKAIKMLEVGYSYKDIGERLNRNSNGVYNKMLALGVVETTRNLNHKYQVNEIAGNGTLIVIEQTRTHGNRHRAYIVQSVKYSTAPTYKISEYDLLNGKEDAYLTNKRIFEGNSLYSHEHMRPYIVDIEQAKTIAPHHNKPILFKCTCGEKLKIQPSNLQRDLKNGVFPCKRCKNTISYGQIAFKNYQTHFNLRFESEKILPDLPNRRVDFINWENGMWVEIQGVQHTDKNARGHKQACEQDAEKRAFNKNSDKYNLIEIDMKISSWKYFKEQINNESQLPSINTEDEKAILELIRINSKFPIDDMEKMYIEEKVSIKQVASAFDLSFDVVRGLFEKNNIELHEESFNKYSKLPDDNIIHFYTKDKLSLEAISEMYDVSRETIRKVLENNDVKIRTYKEINVKQLPEQEIVKTYQTGDYSIKQLAKMYNVGQSKISNILKNNNVEIKPVKMKLPTQEIIKEYNSGVSATAIAKKYGVGRVTITNLLKDNDVVMRSGRFVKVS